MARRADLHATRRRTRAGATVSSRERRMRSGANPRRARPCKRLDRRAPSRAPAGAYGEISLGELRAYLEAAESFVRLLHALERDPPSGSSTA